MIEGDNKLKQKIINNVSNCAGEGRRCVETKGQGGEKKHIYPYHMRENSQRFPGSYVSEDDFVPVRHGVETMKFNRKEDTTFRLMLPLVYF